MAGRPLEKQKIGAGEIIKTPAIELVISRSLMYLDAGYSLHLSGPPGTGKTALAIHLAQQFDRQHVILHGDSGRTAEQMRDQTTGIERKSVIDNYVRDVYKSSERTNVIHSLSSVQWACIHGCFLIYDEFNRSRAEVNNILLPVLSEGIIPMNQKDQRDPLHLQKVDPHFRLIATSNPDDSAGAHATQEALLDRMITITLNHWDFETEVSIIRFHSGLDEAEARAIIGILHVLRQAVAPHSMWPSIRSGIMLARILQHAQLAVDTQDPIFQVICCDVLNADSVASARSGKHELRLKIDQALQEIFLPSNTSLLKKVS